MVARRPQVVGEATWGGGAACSSSRASLVSSALPPLPWKPRGQGYTEARADGPPVVEAAAGVGPS
eukprot:9568688-Prorocentrum_lima.AAC.1